MCINIVEKGMLARSKAGHDKGHLYVISDVDEAYVYLVDGKTKSIHKPKKKKLKHIQVIYKKYEIDGKDDVAVKRILKLFDKETGRI